MTTQRPQGRILKVGRVWKDKEGELHIVGWTIDLMERVELVEIEERTGAILWCGYTYEELREITSRPSEFLVGPCDLP